MTPEPVRGGLAGDASAAARHSAENPTGLTAQPGHLQGTATLVIQTRQAQRLLVGRAPREGKVRMVGLPHFSGLMRAIWVAASQDDPYADWHLVQVQDGIEHARLELGRWLHQLQERLQSVPGLEIQIAQSASPVRVPLRFATPYGYLGAYLIADYDQLVRAVLTAQHVGVLSRDAGEELSRRGARRVRRVFTTPLGWKPLAIIREEARTNTPRAQRARDQMGELPADILAGTRRARLAPILRKSSPVGATW